MGPKPPQIAWFMALCLTEDDNTIFEGCSWGKMGGKRHNYALYMLVKCVQPLMKRGWKVLDFAIGYGFGMTMCMLKKKGRYITINCMGNLVNYTRLVERHLGRWCGNDDEKE